MSWLKVRAAPRVSRARNVEVNAFQRLSDVVIQKSIREGFGLVVSEALWKGTPVVAGLSGEERDPVCGMRLDPGQALEYEYSGQPYHFCSESCRQQFRAAPEYFLRASSFRS